MISLKVQSTIASSNMIRDASRNNFAISFYFEKPKKSVSLGFNDKINCECIVRPPSSITIATPDVLVTNAIKRLDLTCASNVR